MLQELIDLSRHTPDSHVIGLGFLGMIIVSFLLYEYLRCAARLPKFDGPLGYPIVGNIAQIHNRDAPEQYRVWARKYGAVYQIQLGNIPVLVINSAAAAKAMLVGDGQANASRPEFYTFHKIISKGTATTLGTSPYDDSLKRRRKATASALNRPAVQSYIPHLDIETRSFVSEALEYGKGGQLGIDPMPLFLRLNLSISLTLHWGTRMESQSDLFNEIVHVEDEISRLRSTTANPQDYIPLLRLNPFRGESATANDMRIRRDRYMRLMDRGLDDRMKKSTHKPCIRANLMTDKAAKLTNFELDSLNLTMLAAGLDTMNGAVSWGIAVLATNQEVQENAYKAIREKYNENEPLCDAGDDQSVRYVVTMVREVLRLYAVVRLSLPRRTTSEYMYDGKLVPKGTVIFLNVWACNLDEQIWSDPEVFRPERFDEQPEAPIFTFGVGNRMCIGAQLAYRELYVLFLRIISSFRIEADGEVDAHPLHVGNPGGLVNHAKEYKVKFIPRNVEALKAALASERK